jgi:hypothetical protein
VSACVLVAALSHGCGGNEPGSIGTIDAPGSDSGALDDVSAVDATLDATRGSPRSEYANLGLPDGRIDVCGLGSCAPNGQCPDLVIDPYDLRSSIVFETRTFASDNCAFVEGCIEQPGTRKLLRFDVATVNVGTADLVVGNPQNGSCFYFSPCHGHYHFKEFSKYVLYKLDGLTVAAIGHKQAFCLEDVEAAPIYSPPAPVPANPFTCTNQGIHVGYEDVYPAVVDCQWIDITDVPSGNYILSVSVNIAQYLPESNYDNNEERVTVTVP